MKTKNKLLVSLLFLLTLTMSLPGTLQARILETDVVVVGGGGAGLAAAVEASNAGVDVIVLEKLPFLGGSTMVSGGAVSGAGHRFQIDAGITEDSAAEHLADLLREGDFANNLTLAKTFTDNAGDAIDWLADLGCEFIFAPGFPEHSIQRTVRSSPNVGTGADIVQTLQRAATEAGATIHTDTLVTELVTNTAGEVIGVQALDSANEKVTVIAQRVILATGGFVGNQDMLLQYAPDLMEMEPVVTGYEQLKGEGILMAQRVGAGLENMEYVKIYPTGAQLRDGSPAFVRYYVATPLGGILVNREGVRFMQEYPASFVQVMAELKKQTDGRMFLVFDSEMAEGITEAVTPLVLGWSNERVKEDLEQQELLEYGATIEELAKALAVDADALVSTASESALSESGPFYGIEIGPNMLFTLGGMRINQHGQALDGNGQVMNGLYAAGEIAGSGHGSDYMSGNYVAYALVFGRIAGQNAANDILQ